uniref:Lipoprotein n=1 Tax=Candidatus Kentrum sp. DK TaxID=2126562 RepID=A0A450TDX6_9GAMM|nr:MAG: hypothetical protein BECKDK2373B_GA0170837_11469 [Candidatus Kentron sp. DK]
MSNTLRNWVALAVAALVSASCGSQENRVEILRASSPDGKVDAVVMVSSADATTPKVHELYIVARDRRHSDVDLVLTGDHFEDFSVNWRTVGFLDIDYSQGRIFRFSNFWQSKSLDNYSYVVELRLNPPPKDYSLSKRDRWMQE